MGELDYISCYWTAPSRLHECDEAMANQSWRVYWRMRLGSLQGTRQFQREIHKMRVKGESDQWGKGGLNVKKRLEWLLTNDTDVAFPKHALPIVTDCNDGKSIPLLHSISPHLATQNTPLERSSYTLFHFPHTTTSEGGDLAFIS